MAVRTRKWSPWNPLAAAATETRKYRVVVKPMKLEGLLLSDNDDGGGGRDKAVEIKMRWKGELKSGFVPPFHRGGSRRHTECSGERFVKKEKPVTWDDEFQNVCDFSVVWKDGENKFLPWDVSFKLQYGNYRGKKTEIGKASLNLSGILSKESLVVTKLPIDLHIAGTTRQATLSVLVIFMEGGDSQEPALLVRNSSWFGGMARNEMIKASVSSSDSSESIISETRSTTDSQSSSSSSGSETQFDSVKKLGLFSWKRRRLSFRVDHTKVEPLTSSGPLQAENHTVPHTPTELGENDPTGNWESKELTSRDGQTKLNTNIFFASFDQCSNKAAGESACTALVAVIAHWLHSNQQSMPTKKEFENLIIQGSSEWRKLCENEDYVTQFPNKHFDLETVIHAGIKPVNILPEKSFVGFFSPEKFEVLKGAMSFDDIWAEIGSQQSQDFKNGSRIYLVSWNDHFFVLTADEDAYYIIDTLGERLFEGCTQAYILKFDKESSLKVRGKKDEKMEEFYQGKDCCREFIKRFLAAIPLGELELDEEKAAVPYYSLHHRLQIEFNFSTVLPESTSLISSI